MNGKFSTKFHLLSIAALLLILAASPISAAAQSLSADLQLRTDPGDSVTPVVSGIELNIYSISGRYILRSDVAIADDNGEPLAGALVNLEITQSRPDLDPYKDYLGRVRYISAKTNTAGLATVFTKYQHPGKWTVCVDSIEFDNKEFIPGENSERCSVISD